MTQPRLVLAGLTQCYVAQFYSKQSTVIEFGSCRLLHRSDIHRINAELSETDEDVEEGMNPIRVRGGIQMVTQHLGMKRLSVAHSLRWARILIKRSEVQFAGCRD
jgi:hypothetical protein